MTQQLSTVAIDLAKKVFHLVGADTTGKILWRKRLTRHALMPFIAQLPPVLIGLEACGGAHYWTRRFREHGHEVKLMAPQFVKPFVKSNKNDMRDAGAIAEAVTRPTMRFVPTKDIDQQDLQALHRVVVYSTRAGNESGLLQVNPPDPNHPLSHSPTGFSWLQSPRHGALSTHSLSREPRSSTSSSPSAYGIWGCGHSGTRNRSTSLRLHT